MKHSKLYAGLTAWCLGAAPLMGCVFTAEPLPSPPPAEPTGSVTVEWSIAGSARPEQCAAYRVDALELVIYELPGQPLVVVDAPCENFSVTVDLAPGVYQGQATLIDANQRPVSRRLPLEDLVVKSGTDLKVDIDFPATSIY